MILTANKLSTTYSLSEKKTPVKYLNSVKPDWIDEFPVTMSNHNARNLIVNLIESSAVDKKSKSNQPFSVKHNLESISDDLFELTTFIDLNEVIEESMFKEFFNIDDEQLREDYFTLIILVNENEFKVHLNFQFGKNSFRPSQTSLTYTDINILRLIKVYIRDIKGNNYIIKEQYWQDVDEDDIGVFANKKDAIEFKFSGSGKLNTPEGYLFSKSNLNQIGGLNKVGKVKGLDLAVYHFNSDLKLVLNA